MLKLVAIFAALAVSCRVLCQESASYFGKKIGDFNPQGGVVASHNSMGSVYAIDDRTLWLRGFSYDGLAPDAFLWAGITAQPSSSGEIIPKEDGSLEKLGLYNNQDIVVTLSSGRVITDYKWISVWCRSFAANFADVYITTGFVAPSSYSLGALGFTPRRYNVMADDVIIVDSKTIRFENLFYDGTAPATYFWVGTGTPSSSGFIVPDEDGNKNTVLRAYTGETITIVFDGNLTVFDIDYISIWCESARQDFGSVTVPDSSLLNIPPSYSTQPSGPAFENCEQLNENMQVLWTINGGSIDIQLKGTVPFGEYMSFGISGSTTRTTMIGSDVAVAWFDGEQAQAVDYYLSGYSQCSSGNGACPDVQSIPQGRNDLTGVSGSVEDGVTAISYTRLLNTGDIRDKIIPSSGETYVSWAIGPVNSDGLAAKHSVRTEVVFPDYGKKINFGRTPSSTCTNLVVPTTPVQGWNELSISSSVTTFEAKIGPNGGQKGYSYITGNVGWGISWYINNLLIPRLTLTRGTTYTFKVNGGNNPSQSADYHPFYLTNDPAGGYASLSQAEQVLQVIYAGPVSGSLCQYVSSTGVDQSSQSSSFLEYSNTLTSQCISPQSSGTLEFTPDSSTPNKIYYQCYTHRYLGWEIDIVDPSGGTDGCSVAPCLNGGQCFPTTTGGYFCLCTPDYSGNNCEVAGPCAQSPCFNGGTCIPTIAYRCICPAGYSGNNCEQVDQTPCGQNPCMNGGACTNLGTTNYICSCPQFYYGTNCESVNPCTPNPCLNGGNCNAIGATYICTCAEGFGGNNCQDTVTTDCSSSPCVNGVCTPQSTGYVCTCVTGYVGINCETPASCNTGYCLNGGTCRFDILTASAMCICNNDFTGNRCDTALIGCNMFPCQNQGTCISVTGSYFCVCPPGYAGINCETPPVSPCSTNLCLNGGTCTDVSATAFVCTCVVGFTGVFCETALTGCNTFPCQNQGTCISVTGSYFCVCPPGYAGINCETPPVSPCSTNLCLNGGTCTDVSATAFVCTCVVGFTGVFCETGKSYQAIFFKGGPLLSTDVYKRQTYICTCAEGFGGNNCQDIPQPCSNNPCINGGLCTNVDTTSYTCTCPVNYSGTNCETYTPPTAGECSRAPCMNGGTCQTSGTWYICQCLADYMGYDCETGGDGSMPCSSAPCLNGGVCQNIDTASFTCTCLQYYSGTVCEIYTPTTLPCDSNPCINGGVCTSVDSISYMCDCPMYYSGSNCQTFTPPDSGVCSTSPCLNGGTCAPSGTWYACSCTAQFNGSRCETFVDSGADPCSNSPCQNGAACAISGGTYMCTCTIGYEGTNCETFNPGLSFSCSPNPCANGGNCVPSGNAYFCQCIQGFSGYNCDQ
ncbi:fibropellin-1-like [Anneissia japonica]|uniref:fibropellin-1-like n=1 Tax=Anneissia japonica TaxID=1529436 RepID=UPI0014256825|nr:fibropellin-1-like [Anneissia japonica]